MSLVKKTESGAELVINEAPMKLTLELKKALQEELKNLNFSLNEIEGEDFSKAITSMINFVLSADLSERFEMALYECLAYCTYNKAKICYQLFDDMKEARADYYEIIKECVETNLRPFMKSLNSQFPILQIFANLYQGMLSPQAGDSK